MGDFFGLGDKFSNFYKLEAQKIAFAPFIFQIAKAAKELGILEIIYNFKENGCPLDEIIRKSCLSEYSVKVIIDAIKSIGLIIEIDRNFIITKTGYFILKDKMTDININFTNDVCYNGLYFLEDALKSGKPSGLNVFGDWKTIYEGLSKLPDKVKESWFAFDHYYSDSVFDKVLPIVFKNNPKRILDIGGNTGKWAIKCASYDPQVKITIMDLPCQINEAKKTISNLKLNDRIDFLEKDILDSETKIPKEFDIIYMSQFLDCFSKEQIIDILTKAKQSLNEKSKVFILETYVDNQKYETAEFCLNMISLYFTCMANGNSRMYRITDMRNFILLSGLNIIEEISNIGISHTLIICE